MSDKFWEDVLAGSLGSEDTTIDLMLKTEDERNRYARSLHKGRKLQVVPDSLGRTPKAGTRVAFDDSVEALLSYSDFPEPYNDAKRAEGTVVCVRTSSGDTTEFDGRVFVHWDDGQLRSISRHHLLPGSRKRTARSVRIMTADLGDLTDFFRGDGNDLIHKATKDLWSCRVEGDQYVVERLFDTDGEPLKGV
jgi:hypothetical protein